MPNPSPFLHIQKIIAIRVVPEIFTGEFKALIHTIADTLLGGTLEYLACSAQKPFLGSKLFHGLFTSPWPAGRTGPQGPKQAYITADSTGSYRHHIPQKFFPFAKYQKLIYKENPKINRKRSIGICYGIPYWDGFQRTLPLT